MNNQPSFPQINFIIKIIYIGRFMAAGYKVLEKRFGEFEKHYLF